MIRLIETFGTWYFHNPDTINKIENRTGAYLMGHSETGKGNVVSYVGRGNVKERLTAHQYDEYKDDYFRFTYTDDEENACYLECQYYHKYINEGVKLKNKEHPKMEKGLKCQFCNHVGT
jgi:hypothetical protein